MPFLHRKIIIILVLALLIGSGYGALTKHEAARKRAVVPGAKSAATRAETRLLKREDGRLTVEFECPDMTIERDSATGHIIGLDIE